MVRQINEDGVALAKQWEAFIGFAYDDADPPAHRRKIKQGDKIRGTLTIGYGHTGNEVFPGLVISEQQATRFLERDLAVASAAVERNVKVPLNDNQFAALSIFVLNIGAGAFASSTLVKKLNAGNYDAVPSELAKWNKTTIAGKKVTSAGLVNRRAAEAGLWARGSFVQSSGTPAKIERAPLLSPQVLATGTALVSGGGSQLFIGNGPFQWALAVIAVAAVAALGFFYLKERMSN